MSEQDYKSVLKVLSQYESMPVLEIRALVDVGDERVMQIIDDLEREGVVKITSRGNKLDEIVTLRDNAYGFGLKRAVVSS